MAEAPLESELKCNCSYGETLKLKQDNAILMEFAKKTISHMSDSEFNYQSETFKILRDIKEK